MATTNRLEREKDARYRSPPPPPSRPPDGRDTLDRPASPSCELHDTTKPHPVTERERREKGAWKPVVRPSKWRSGCWAWEHHSCHTSPARVGHPRARKNTGAQIGGAASRPLSLSVAFDRNYHFRHVRSLAHQLSFSHFISTASTSFRGPSAISLERPSKESKCQHGPRETVR